MSERRSSRCVLRNARPARQVIGGGRRLVLEVAAIADRTTTSELLFARVPRPIRNFVWEYDILFQAICQGGAGNRYASSLST